MFTVLAETKIEKVFLLTGCFMDHNNMVAGFSHHLPSGQSTRRGSKLFKRVTIIITIVGKCIYLKLPDTIESVCK